MSKQPEALRLAAWLNEGAWHQMTLGDVEAAGRELRRLHSINQEMLGAMRRAVLALAFSAESSPAMRDDYTALSNAIDKATQS